MFPKPRPKKEEKTEQRAYSRLSYRTARAEYLFKLARQQGRLNVTEHEFERLMLTPRTNLTTLKASEYPLCEMRLSQTGCDEKPRRARDIHHRRGRVGDDLTDQSNFVGCCRTCHDYVEHHRKFAVNEGWSELRNTTTEKE